MKCLFFAFSLISSALALADETLQPALETTYSAWRESMIRHDVSVWQRVTAEHRRVEVRNRIVSEKLPFPSSIFELPTVPPTVRGLKLLEAKENGPTAKASYFGKIDFGVGGTPSDNLLVLSFVKGNGGWLYDRADFVNLEALPSVRKELAVGNLKYLKETPETQPTGKIPTIPVAVQPAKHVAKVYVFCPGREVEVEVNKVSLHHFANAKEAEVVIGGALDGANEVKYTIKKLPGSTGKEAMTVRVYLMSEIPNAKPLKVFEYQITEGQKPKSASGSFVVDAATLAKLAGS